MTPYEWSEIVRNYGIVAAGAVGIGIAIWRAIAADRQSRAQRDQVAQARREHVADIFGQAIGKLDDEKLHVRLGAIYTMREIVEAYPDLSRPTIDLLTSYLATVNYADEEPPADVRAIMTLILPRAGDDRKDR
ncbi:hypothetical protein [Amaricoccus sp.]|uniref:hypothetical protein n=1 Tax=Amaricoccus sp. TaxID=1872485 RepID=UPI001B6649F6|nr:hypothetical protein [Amaricoccus sp.]MBP7243169.1 hypothetical protein [Amaricoccus sp.]